MSGRIIPTSAPVSRPCPHPASIFAALAQSIKDWGRELGFQQVGIAGLRAGRARGSTCNAGWTAGYQGEMDYMAAHGSKRSHPDELVPGTLRVVSLRMDYLPGDTQMAQRLGQPEKAYVSRYALGRDYHKLIRKRLQQLAERIQQAIGPFGYRAFVDSAPVLEKAIAEQAGLGWIGKNTLVLNRKAGSYFFLGELFVDLPLPVDAAHASEHCGRCTRLHGHLPDRRLCRPLCAGCAALHFLPDHRAQGRQFPKSCARPSATGCLAAMTARWSARGTALPNPPSRATSSRATAWTMPSWPTLFRWSEEEFLSRTEGSPLRRAGYERWLRNLAVGLGNAPSSIPVLEALKARRDYPSELVREHVEWALARHGL